MRVALLLLIVAGCLSLSTMAAEPAAPAAPDFKREVLPILEAKCIACHGTKKQGKLDLRTRAEGWDIQTRFAALAVRDREDLTGRPAIGQRAA